MITAWPISATSQSARPIPSRPWERIIGTSLLPVLLLAFGLRLWGLTEHNLWWDEGIGVWLARMPLWESVGWTAGDVHPPLYYMLLHGWWRMAGESVFALRALSAFFSLLTIPLVYRLGRVLGGARTGALAALLLALSRFSIWWAQEIRMYALAAMLATGALWAAAWLWQAKGQHRQFAWLAYVGFTTASLYTLYLTITVIAVTNLGFLAYMIRWRTRPRITQKTEMPVSSAKRRIIDWVTAQAATVILFMPWAFYALPQMHAWSSDAPFTPGFFMQLYTTILAVGSPLEVARYLPLTIGLFLGLALAVIVLWRRVRLPAQFGGLGMMVTGLVLPPAVVAFVSLPVLQFYFARPLVPRYLLPLAACYTVLVAWAAVDLPAQRAEQRSGKIQSVSAGAGLSLAGCALVAALVGLASYYPGRTQRDDYTTIAEVLTALRRPEDAVVLYVDRDWPIFAAYYGGPRQDLAYGANYSNPDAVAMRMNALWESVEGVWLVATPESVQADPGQHVPNWLREQAVVSEMIITGDVALTFYARTQERALTRKTVVAGYVLPNPISASFGLVGSFIPLSRYQTGDTVHVGLYWVLPQPEGAQIILQGPKDRRSFPTTSVPGNMNIVRGQTDIPLTPDLVGGKYALIISAPGFSEQAIGSFTLVHKSVGDNEGNTTIPNPMDIRFGEQIHLVGYALPRSSIAPGDSLALTLYWQTEAPLTERYKVFTHLLGETFNAATGNFLWGQQDNEPKQGQAPTTLWAPGTVLTDAYLIPIAADAPAGIYSIEIGLYGLVDGERLPVSDAHDETQVKVQIDAVLLTTIQVSH